MGTDKGFSSEDPKEVGLEGVVDELKNMLSGLDADDITEEQSATPEKTPPPPPPPDAKAEVDEEAVQSHMEEVPPFPPVPDDKPVEKDPPPNPESDKEFWSGNVLGWPGQTPDSSVDDEPAMQALPGSKEPIGTEPPDSSDIPGFEPPDAMRSEPTPEDWLKSQSAETAEKLSQIRSKENVNPEPLQIETPDTEKIDPGPDPLHEMAPEAPMAPEPIQIDLSEVEETENAIPQTEPELIEEPPAPEIDEQPPVQKVEPPAPPPPAPSPQPPAAPVEKKEPAPPKPTPEPPVEKKEETTRPAFTQSPVDDPLLDSDFNPETPAGTENIDQDETVILPPPPKAPPTKVSLPPLKEEKDPTKILPEDVITEETEVPPFPQAPGIPGTLEKNPDDLLKKKSPKPDALGAPGPSAKPENLIQIAVYYPQGKEKSGQHFVSNLKRACSKSSQQVNIQAVLIQPWDEAKVEIENWAKSAKLSGADIVYVMAMKQDRDKFRSLASKAEDQELKGRMIIVEQVGLRALYADVLAELRRIQ